MISCMLNGKKYTVDYITGRALREMEPAAKMYGRIVSLSNAALKGELPEEAKELSIPEAMDEMIRWFCILFGNQFTPDDVLDYYPVDRLMHDIALALMAVQTQTTSILDIAVPSLTIPVKPGRNLAVIIEVAAMNDRQKKMGFNAARELQERMLKQYGN